MEKTRTGKEVYKKPVRFRPSAARAFNVLSYEGLEAPSGMAFFHEDQLTGKRTSVNAGQSYFGALPRVWAQADSANKMISESCVPIGMLSDEEMELFEQQKRFGVNFMAKGAFWKQPYIQIPAKIARFAPVVLPIVSYLQDNLPDPRLIPALEVVFKISSGPLKKDGKALDPFLDKAQALDWHTDGDSSSDAKKYQLGAEANKAFAKRKPGANELAFLKQRLIVSSAQPTAYSGGWHFLSEHEGDTAGHIISKNNGYPERVVEQPTVFPAGTVVAFTNNNMHTATLSDKDEHRTIMIVSGTIRWGALRKIAEEHPDIMEKLSQAAPGSLIVPAAWKQRFDDKVSTRDIERYTQERMALIPNKLG